MKNFFTFILFIILSAPVFAQENEYQVESLENEPVLSPRNVIKLNFFGAIGKSFTLEYERVLNKKISAQVAFGYRNINLDWILVDPYHFNTDQVDFIQSGFTVVPEIKYYWTHFSETLIIPTGSYVAPFLRIGYYDKEFIDNHYDEYDVSYNLTTLGGGIVFGFQVLAGRVFAVDAFAGPQVKYRMVTNERWEKPANAANAGDVALPIDDEGITLGLRVGLTVGIGF